MAALLAASILIQEPRTPAAAYAGDPACNYKPYGYAAGYHVTNACFLPPWPLASVYTTFRNMVQWVVLTGDPPRSRQIWHSLALVSGDPCYDFAEVGFVTGWDADTTQSWFFFGDFYYSEGNYYRERVEPRQARDGSLHSYQIIWQNGTTNYKLYIDGNEKATVTNSGYGGCKAAAGMTAWNPASPQEFTHTFDLTPLAWWPIWGEPWWHYGFGRFYIESPCGTIPYCYNGIYVNYDPNFWSDNKPEG